MPHRTIHADIAAYLDPQYAGNESAAAGSPVQTPAIDRIDADSAMLALGFTATLAQDETLSLTALQIEESDDGVAFDAPEDLADGKGALLAPLVAATGAAGGSTETGAAKVAVNLEGRKRFYRLTYTPTLSAGGSATIVPAVAHGGSRELPVGAG